MKFINKLEGKRVLIFGGTSGIGFAVAEACLEFGANIIISGSNQAKLDLTVQRLRDGYPTIPKLESRVFTVVCDLSGESTLESGVKTVLDKATNGGKDKLDHVVFTAGEMTGDASLAGNTIEQIHQGETVRLIAPMMLSKHLPDFINVSPDSSFTITGGVNSKKPFRSWALTACRSAASEGLARGLAVDLAPVRVNAVEPGAIKTELLERLGLLDQEQALVSKLTIGRLGRPEDTAEAYLYCMKDGFVTGSVIQTNGGYLLL